MLLSFWFWVTNALLLLNLWCWWFIYLPTADSLTLVYRTSISLSHLNMTWGWLCIDIFLFYSCHLNKSSILESKREEQSSLKRFIDSNRHPKGSWFSFNDDSHEWHLSSPDFVKTTLFNCNYTCLLYTLLPSSATSAKLSDIFDSPEKELPHVGYEAAEMSCSSPLLLFLIFFSCMKFVVNLCPLIPSVVSCICIASSSLGNQRNDN